jgi:hypothetical protein
MRHQRIENVNDKARVWIVRRAPDGRLQEQLDPRFLAGLNPGQSAEDVADTLITVAGELEMASSRLW